MLAANADPPGNCAGRAAERFETCFLCQLGGGGFRHVQRPTADRAHLYIHLVLWLVGARVHAAYSQGVAGGNPPKLVIPP